MYSTSPAVMKFLSSTAFVCSPLLRVTILLNGVGTRLRFLEFVILSRVLCMSAEQLESTSTAVRVPLVSMVVLVSEQWNVSGGMFCILVPLILPSGSSMQACAICEAKGLEERLGVSRKIISSFFASVAAEQWLLMLQRERSAAELGIHLDWLARPFWLSSKTWAAIVPCVSVVTLPLSSGKWSSSVTGMSLSMAAVSIVKCCESTVMRRGSASRRVAWG